MRKDISAERVFNLAILVSLGTLFFARFGYAVLNPSANFLNLFVFFLFPYFPGLSLVSGVVGGSMIFFLISDFKKMPTGHLFDLFSISFLSAFPIGLFGYFLLSRVHLLSLKPILIFLIAVLMFVFFIKVLLPKKHKNKFQDGSVGFMFLALFSLILFVESITGVFKVVNVLKIEELVVLVATFLISLILLIKQENLLSKIRRGK
ncbi:MAG: hypothetical protein AAB662_02955 [Patescibacteria group bacterium]